MDPIPYWPFAVYFGATVTVITGMLLLSHLLGERHHDRVTDEAYESGILPTGSGRLRFSIKFFLIAILFVIFDLELVFIFAWAVSIRELGWAGLAGVMVFIAILVIGLVYEWRMGSLDWASPNPYRHRMYPPQPGTSAKFNPKGEH